MFICSWCGHLLDTHNNKLTRVCVSMWVYACAYLYISVYLASSLQSCKIFDQNELMLLYNLPCFICVCGYIFSPFPESVLVQLISICCGNAHAWRWHYSTPGHEMKNMTSAFFTFYCFITQIFIFPCCIFSKNPWLSSKLLKIWSLFQCKAFLSGLTTHWYKAVGLNLVVISINAFIILHPCSLSGTSNMMPLHCTNCLQQKSHWLVTWFTWVLIRLISRLSLF